MKNIFKQPTIVCIVCLLSLSSVSGQENILSEYTFNAITVYHGLPINFIDDIYKDSNGFLWVSTQGGGLSRYDGYEFMQFNVNSEPLSLKSNFIRKTCEDNFRRLWVISDSGIDIINLTTMQFAGITINNPDYDELLAISAISLIKDKKGNIWVFSENEIFQVLFNKNGDIQSIRTTESNDGTFAFTTINEIDDEIWAGCNGSIYQLSINQNDNISLLPILNIPGTGNKFFISAVLKKDNLIWIGSEGGLFRYNMSDKKLKHYLHNPGDPYSISQDKVTDLQVMGNGILVASTLKGLSFYEPVSDKFLQVSHRKDVLTLNCDFINCLLSDGNNLWIGTEAGGVNKMTYRRLAITNYIHDDKNPYSISPNPVNAIIEDSKGDLWVGTVEGGLNRKQKDSDKFIRYTTADNLSHNSVSALEEDMNGNLWVGTWGKGLNILNLNKLPQVVYENFNVLDLDYIAVLKYDPINKGMWVGTNRNIFFYDEKTNSMKAPFPESIIKNIKGTLGCLIDENNVLWIGTTEGILLVSLDDFDSNATYTPEFLVTDDQHVNTMFFKNINCLYQSYDKSVWMGSNGYGICKVIREDGTYNFKSFTMDQGLINNAVFGILEDEQGLMWIATGYGLSCYNSKINRFFNYSREDGLINDQFYWNAAYKSPTTKKLYFGNMGGLSELKGSNQLISSSQKRKVIFTKLQILNKTIWYSKNKYINKDITYADRVELHEQDKSFSIEFSALDYDNPSTIVYSYRLLGFDNEWIEIHANRRFVNYTNLKPGTYTFQVRYMSGDLDWSENISQLEIIVHPFFYKTSWFIGLCVLFAVLISIWFYRRHINTLKKQQDMLRKKVEERTKELKKQKELLEEHAVEMKMQNEMLTSQNEKISYQRKELIEMSKKVHEAMTDRISFFTNITHEFRTPITLIIAPIERALKLSTNPKVIEQLQFVARNSKHLLSLVNQLMDFRKVESDRMKINLITGNLISYLDEIIYPFESFAQERKIKIGKFYRLPSPYVMFDEEAVRKLVTNLLSNAIKYTPDDGFVSLYVSLIKNTEGTGETLYICVRDSGTGIKEDDLERIFNRFYQSKENKEYPVYGQSGTGIGLYLCKKIIKAQNGKIYARNNKTKGASIRILLPVIKEKQPALVGNEMKALPAGTAKYEKNHSEIILNNNRRLNLLVVEDNQDMRKFISSILSEHYNVTEAENGQEALVLLKTKHIDFIISDLMMPVMDGLELSKKVKDDLLISHIPFLMLTAKTSLETQISSYKVGVDEFITKPFDEELLLTRINNIIESRKAYQRKFSLQMNIDELNIVEESNDDKFLRKAMEIVKENYKDTEYEVSDFIESMGYSKSVINKKMQLLTGQSAGNFIRNYRLTVAHEMILKNRGSMNVSEIAYSVGFNDPKYFTRCFKKHFGFIPSEKNKSKDIAPAN